MKVGASVIPEWLVHVLLRLRLTVLIFPEMFGASFKILYYYLENGESYCECGGVSLSVCVCVCVCIYMYLCIPYMSRKTYWMKSVLTQMYKVCNPPCNERHATVLQESDIFIQIRTWQRLMDVLELRCIKV